VIYKNSWWGLRCQGDDPGSSGYIKGHPGPFTGVRRGVAVRPGCTRKAFGIMGDVHVARRHSTAIPMDVARCNTLQSTGRCFVIALTREELGDCIHDRRKLPGFWASCITPTSLIKLHLVPPPGTPTHNIATHWCLRPTRTPTEYRARADHG